MSLRLVKQQLAALSEDQDASPGNLKTKPQADKTKSKITKLKIKAKKKLHKKKKDATQKALSDEDIRNRNLEYYRKTAGTCKGSEAMIKVQHRSSK